MFCDHLAALAFGSVFDGLGAAHAIENLFTDQMGLSPWMVLILMQLSFLVMGTFLDDTAMLVIVAPLYVPLVDALGFNLIWYGILYTITTQIAYMTPPFGYKPFYAGHGPARNHLARHLPIYNSICRRDDRCTRDHHDFPGNRPVVPGVCLRQLTQSSDP